MEGRKVVLWCLRLEMDTRKGVVVLLEVEVQLDMRGGTRLWGWSSEGPAVSSIGWGRKSVMVRWQDEIFYPREAAKRLAAQWYNGCIPPHLFHKTLASLLMPGRSTSVNQ